MNWKVDWLSIVIPAPDWADENFRGLRHAAFTKMMSFLIPWSVELGYGDKWSLEGGRAPFNLSIMHEKHGLRLFFSASLPMMLLEITGTGCTWIAENNNILALVAQFRDQVSRIDIACDFETDISPAEFAVQRNVQRFKAYGEVVSSTGHTYYVGSLKSERFARVYRYNEPHPRSKFLRVEHVFRKESAKLAIDYLSGHTTDEWIAAIGAIFGWEHSLWNSDARIGKMSARVVERPEEGKTVFWLYNTVVPCLARLLRENRVSLAEFEAAVAAAVGAADFEEAQRSEGGSE